MDDADFDAEIDLTLPAADQALVAELGAALRAGDPPPPSWCDAAAGAFAWRTVDAELAELAELTFDSLAAAAGPALVRGPAAAERVLVFEAGGRRVEVEVAPVGGGRLRLAGQLVPAGAGSVALRQPSGTTTVEADAHGRFSADAVAPGPLSLRWAVPGAAAVETAWLVV